MISFDIRGYSYASCLEDIVIPRIINCSCIQINLLLNRYDFDYPICKDCDFHCRWACSRLFKKVWEFE